MNREGEGMSAIAEIAVIGNKNLTRKYRGTEKIGKTYRGLRRIPWWL
jgi:hypothetical protein